MTEEVFSNDEFKSEMDDIGQTRLAEILDEYLAAVEQGLSFEPESLLKKYPEDAENLAPYLSGLRHFYSLADRQSNSFSRIIDSRLADGKTIGDYCLLEEIGRGGMGVVYKAIQTSTERHVAVKILPLTSRQHQKQIQRFKNESRAAASIRHPNIVPVHDVGEDNGIHYYAMELIEGNSLALILDTLTLNSERREADEPIAIGADDARLTPIGFAESNTISEHIRVIARLGWEAADALHAAHQCGVVHRDVKPSNLLVDNYGKLWVTDFGLASCCEVSDLTQTGDVLGTLRYMSPEQANGHREFVDHRTDIYSLGVTLYELATLHHPTGANSDLKLDEVKNLFNRRTMRQWNPNIPKEFRTIVMKSIAELPSERYTTAKQMADDLCRFCEGRKIRASAPNIADRTVKFFKRNRSALAILCCVVIAASVAQLINTILLQQSNLEKEQALVRAHENLRQAQEVLDHFGNRLADQLGAIPGAENVRHQLLSDSMEFYERFESRSIINGEPSPELALAYTKMGILSEKMGRFEIALRKHSSALAIWESNFEVTPYHDPTERKIALCHNSIGMLLGKLERFDEAVQSLLRAHEIQLSLISANCDLDVISIDSSITCNNLGVINCRLGEYERAIGCFNDAIEFQIRLSDSAKESEENLRSLAISHSNLAALTNIDRYAVAERSYRGAIQVQSKLARLNPVNRIYRSDLANTHYKFGKLKARQDDWSNAAAEHEKAILIQEFLVRSSPNQVNYRQELATMEYDLGFAQAKLGRCKVAEACYSKAIGLLRDLVELQPKNIQQRKNLGELYNNLGQLLTRQNRLDDAKSAFSSAHAMQTLSQ